MSKNKHALIRYRALDACFRNRRIKYSFPDLQQAVNNALEAYDPSTKGISRSMLYADISFMESTDGWRADIVRTRDGKRMFLRYNDPDFSIDDGPLNQLEVSQLKEALAVLSQFKGLPQFEWMEETVAKLNQGIMPENDATIISFDANQYLKGIEFLGEIYNAILYGKVLTISYKDFKAEQAYEVLFHPYFLKQYNNRWFAFGLNPSSARPVQTMALDRIEGINIAQLDYIPNTTINFAEYFDDIIGVSIPEGVEAQQINLKVAPSRAGYVQTKPLHGSQKSKLVEDGYLDVSLQLIPNRELLQSILSFGSAVEVLSPASFKEELHTELQTMLALYE